MPLTPQLYPVPPFDAIDGCDPNHETARTAATALAGISRRRFAAVMTVTVSLQIGIYPSSLAPTITSAPQSMSRGPWVFKNTATHPAANSVCLGANPERQDRVRVVTVRRSGLLGPHANSVRARRKAGRVPAKRRAGRIRLGRRPRASGR